MNRQTIYNKQIGMARLVYHFAALPERTLPTKQTHQTVGYEMHWNSRVIMEKHLFISIHICFIFRLTAFASPS